jgi:hypothetical protein
MLNPIYNVMLPPQEMDLLQYINSNDISPESWQTAPSGLQSLSTVFLYPGREDCRLQVQEGLPDNPLLFNSPGKTFPKVSSCPVSDSTVTSFKSSV